MISTSVLVRKNRKVNKMVPKIIFSAFTLIGVLLGIVTVILYSRGKRKRETCESCEGTIVDLIVKRYGKERRISAVVTYQVEGTEYKFVPSYSSTSMRVGQKVEVLYDAQDPSRAELKAGTLFVPMVTGFLSVVFLAIGIVFMMLF